MKRGWVTPDTYGNNRLNEAGFQAAREIPKPIWSPPQPTAELKKRELEVLNELAHQTGWVTPMYVGGSNRSHHAGTLKKLVLYGYAEAYKNGKVLTAETIIPEPRLTKRAKGSRKFRITDAGVKQWKT